MASPYKINIPMYEGPLDLLLDLIKKQEMNIHDIQISTITSQYLDYLHKLEELDVDVSAEFIYMAATLIYIKSKMLLPPDPLAGTETESTDPRAEFVQRLVEHEKFKNAAQLLYQKQQIEENVWSKPDKSLYNDEGTEGDLVVSLVDLVKVFQQVLERRKEVSRIDLRHEEFTVAQMIAQLRAQILASADNTLNLIQFFEACPSRHAMIVAFLAVLEMVKLQAVALVQEKQFGEILLRKHKMFDVVFDEPARDSRNRRTVISNELCTRMTRSPRNRENYMTNEERKAALEAIIYAADEPATIEQLATALGEEKLAVQCFAGRTRRELRERWPRHRDSRSRRRLQALHQAAAA